MRQLRQEWKTCHERYKYACARGFCADDRDGREDRAIDNMRRIETDIDHLTSKLRNDQPGRNVAAAAVTPVAQRNDELAEEAEMDSSNKDHDDGFNNPRDDAQESSMERPFHPLGMKLDANDNHDEQQSEETADESDEEVEDDGSIEDSESDGNTCHDEDSSNKEDTILSEESSDEVEDDSSIEDAESDSNLFHEESSHYKANNDTILCKSDESVEEVEDDSSIEDAESDGKTIYKESSNYEANDDTTPSESKDSDEEVENDSSNEDYESDGNSIHQLQNNDFTDSSKKNVENEEKAAADYTRGVFKHMRGNEQCQLAVDLTDFPYQPPLPRARGGKSCTSRYVGVNIRGNKWRASIEIDGKKYHIGSYGDEEEAANLKHVRSP